MAESWENVLHVPDTMSAWPLPGKLNLLYEEIDAESTTWVQSFKPFTPESQNAHNKGQCALLAAYVWGTASRDRLRIGADLVHLLFVIDEYTDMERAAGVQEISSIVLDVLHDADKPRSAREPVVGEMTRDFWARAGAISTPQARKHFIEDMTDYLRGVTQQAEDRDKAAIRDVDTYMEARRRDSAVAASFFPGELHLSIPDDAFYHPLVKELRQASIELVVLDNDIASYNREQATGHGAWNILSVVMHQFGFDLYHATEWVAQRHKEVEARFLDALAGLPSFGPKVDAALLEYVHGSLAAWPPGNDSWKFASERYFGKKGAEVQRTRRVPLLPKRTIDPEMRREKVQVKLIEELEEVPSEVVLAAA